MYGSVDAPSTAPRGVRRASSPAAVVIIGVACVALGSIAVSRSRGQGSEAVVVWPSSLNAAADDGSDAASASSTRDGARTNSSASSTRNGTRGKSGGGRGGGRRADDDDDDDDSANGTTAIFKHTRATDRLAEDAAFVEHFIADYATGEPTESCERSAKFATRNFALHFVASNTTLTGQ